MGHLACGLSLRSSLSYVLDVRSTCFHVSYHVFMPRSIFPMCCLTRSTCFYACLYVICLDLHSFYFVPCFRFLDLFFPMCWCSGQHAHMLDVMSSAMPCLDLHVCMHVLCSYAYIYAFTCLYAWVCVLPCLYVYIYMLRCISTCLNMRFHAYMCWSMCLHAWINVLYILYAIIYVLACFTPCLCA